MEKEHGERELNDLKNDVSVKAMELSRLQTLNENFKTKLEELEAASLLFEMTSDLSEEDQSELTNAGVRSYSRTKRGIFLKKALLLKKLMAAVVADKKLGQVEKYSGIKAGIKVGEKIGFGLK